MVLMAEEMVSPGGPSAPVWAFLTTILGLLITNIFLLIQAKLAAREAANKVGNVQVSADQAVANTANVSNGFARNTTIKLDAIHTAVQDIENRISDHLQWHLHQEGKEHHGTHQ